MNSMEKTDQETRAYDPDWLQNLTIQDAVTIIALFAADIAPQDSEGDIERIESVLQRQPLFEESSEATRVRIQKFANAFQSADPEGAARRAAKVLSEAGAEQKACAIADEVANSAPGAATDKKAVMKQVASLLSIPPQ